MMKYATEIVIASEAKQSISPCKGRMDCLAVARGPCHRNPFENFDANEADYNAKRMPGDPDFLIFVVNQVAYNTMDFAFSVTDNVAMGKHLNQMKWTVRDISDCGIKLFTSDRPIIMTNGPTDPDAHLVMPISPQRVFIACNSNEIGEKLHSSRSSDFATECNRQILRNARKYAWNIDDSQVNRAKQNLSADSDDYEAFFRAPPNRRPGTP